MTEVDRGLAEVRDRFFALSSATAPAEAVASYRAEVDGLDAEPTATVDGLAVCWHPTARFKAVRYVDAELLDAGVRDLFARPSAAMPYLAAVFVDPREYSFKTFENILPLDTLFESAPVNVALADGEQLADGVRRFTVRLDDETRERLARLDLLDLYVPPLNAGSRGGDRFIFHSALLAGALTSAVSAALPELVDFSHVNPVFRCNRFEPGDVKFHQHLDTPYRDAARQQISRYTMLLYLTGGSGSPALDLRDAVAITDIEAFTCVIFHQRYEHEGRPYLDGRKVFLRTELIVDAPGLAEEPEIGAMFSKACYLTGESVFAPELAKWADDYYNRVAAAHWNGPDGRTGREPFQYKDFRGVHFVANGYDFWFGKGLSIAECAAITLLDYFNCKVGGEAFRALCATETIEADGTDWIPGFLAERSGASVVAAFDKDVLFPEAEPDESDLDVEDSTRDPEIVGLFQDSLDFARAHIGPAPVLFLGQDVVLDAERFVVDGDLIHVVGDRTLGRVTFASSDIVDGPRPTVDAYVHSEVAVGAAHFLVPPILFRETTDGYHLRFDFFRNSWMVKHDQVTVHVPALRWTGRYTEEPAPGKPWLDEIRDLAVVPGKGESLRPREDWWTGRPGGAGDVADWIIYYENAYDEDQ